MAVRLGIDIGGTFTDIQVFDARTGRSGSVKTPTTPEDPSIGLMAGIDEAAGRFGFALADVSLLLHGTTIATNAVLERKLPAQVRFGAFRRFPPLSLLGQFLGQPGDQLHLHLEKSRGLLQDGGAVRVGQRVDSR